MQTNLYKRLARAEAMADVQRSELMETLQRAYHMACQAGDAEQAADLARRIRNKLLDSSDKEMSLDRIGLDTTSATKFIASLIKIMSGSWAQYRQALRDLPDQPGFPFDVIFPDPPQA